MSDQKSKILVVTNLYPVPWAVNRASFNKQQFDRLGNGQAVALVVLLPWTEWLKHRTECVNNESLKYCPYFYIPKIGRRLVPYFQCLSLALFIPWIKKQQFHSLYSSWGFPDAVSVSMLNRWLNLPYFVKVHGTDVNENTLFSSRSRLMKKWLSKAKGIFCASEALANALKAIGISNEKLLVNYNGVNREVFFADNQNQQQLKLIFVGSLIPTKGVKELIDAFIVVQNSINDISLDIIGEGPLKQYIQDEIASNDLNIHLHGSIPLKDVAEKIRQSTLLVLPSYREGVPNVLLEAFASGVPVIATDVGGIPEIVNEDVGLLVEARNANVIASAILEGLEKEWDKERIISHASQFDWNKNVEFVLENMGLHATVHQ